MFTGIIETLGEVKKIEEEGTNLHFTIYSSFTDTLKVDQSVAHNGVCLTVTEIINDCYKVTAIQETLEKTNLGKLQINESVNLERAMISGARLDGHMVQGHVDATGTCIDIQEKDGSWVYTFRYTPTPLHFLVDKGSICVSGVSLTVVNPVENKFSVAIIPYTQEHTTFKNFKLGDTINLEFDVLGKYIAKYAQLYLPALTQNS
ncbi:MAG: riboflavin synthase [Saprospiraceae bacterium]